MRLYSISDHKHGMDERAVIAYHRLKSDVLNSRGLHRPIGVFACGTRREKSQKASTKIKIALRLDRSSAGSSAKSGRRMTVLVLSLSGANYTSRRPSIVNLHLEAKKWAV